MAKRRIVWAALLLAVILVPAFANVAYAVTCSPTNVYLIVEACEWDWGCFFNTSEPDGQKWTTVYRWYACDDGSGYWTVDAHYESGPCCPL